VLVHQAPCDGGYYHARVVHGAIQTRGEVADVLVGLLVFSLNDVILVTVGLYDLGKDGDEQEPLGCPDKTVAEQEKPEFIREAENV
jgi:hypothetical protein